MYLNVKSATTYSTSAESVANVIAPKDVGKQSSNINSRFGLLDDVLNKSIEEEIILFQYQEIID